jgi:cell division septation protein DedD
LSDSRDNFGRKIQSVFLFFLLFGLAAYFFVYVTEKMSEPSKITIAQKPVENPDEMTDPSSGGEITYKLGENGDVDVSERAAGEEPAPQEDKAETKPESAPKPVAKKEPEKSAPPKPVSAAKPVEKKPEPPKPVAKPVEKKPEPKPKPAPAPAKKEAPKPAAKGVYVLQLAAFKDEATAKSEMNRLKKSFPDIYYVKIDLGAKGVWYRLRCLPSATYEEAAKKRDAVKAKYRLDPIVVKSGP